MTAWETILTIVENKLWKDENRHLPVTRKAFQVKLGWSPTIQAIFAALGFNLVNPDTPDAALSPPYTNPDTLVGRRNRAKLLRAWVEISAWIAEYKKRFAPAFKDMALHKLWVKIESAREMYQSGIGAHPDQIPRGLLPASLQDHQDLEEWELLGMTPTSYSWELLAFAYFAQTRCDPAHTVEYFSAFYKIFDIMVSSGDVPTDLQSIIFDERNRNRFTHDNVREAVQTLGFGRDGPLHVEFDDDVDDEFVRNAWREAVRRAWHDPVDGSAKWTAANEAFRIVAETRGSVALRRAWEQEASVKMTPDNAFHTLEVPKDVDEGMLITVYAMRVEDQPSQADRMREAMAVIAEFKDSARLREFLKSGADPGEVVEPTRPDWPRGLNQLGNTCYLNSLLQYFYTIKDLREAVEPLLNASMKNMDDDKLTDDDLKRHRVGGRLVTRREIMRSKKFVSQLADLFWQMEHCETAAVTPTIELAKLALVTSKDEEEDDVDRGGTDSSNDTDATLVEDAPMHTAPTSMEASSSVLGKRARDTDRMDVDGASQEKDATEADDKDKAMDVDAPVVQKPPVPSRKAPESVMMFGRQHDVSECMDNCIFQIETALLKFDGMDGSEDGKTSIIKRLFYGTLKQRITVVPDDSGSRPSIHEKEDLFSLLPVNVSDEGYDLYDGLSGYFDDVVEFESKKARMEVALVDLPPLLQIQLQRAQFDRETMQPYKSQAYVKFGETIYMDRFLDSANPEKKERSKAIHTELSACRDRIHLLTIGKHAPFGPALTSTHEFLQKQEAVELPELDDEFMAVLNSEQDFLKAELEELRARAAKLKQELEDIWANEHEAAYELTSVFIHRGSSPSWGHYFFYSRHLPENPDSWFKYNDSDVGTVSKDEVLADTTGSTANPYMLVFVRKGSEVINTVKRFDLASIENASV
ncbi:hypothetical protein EVG20_g9326 [Dentipellis fragilis]|uniref:Ubiquitin carboxyl-terminal hydrolase n=1 Tax=Dentipellis fragilis TaxID=205917 RepID=A0A4Y9Y213_9AGAM|nr:hypothetical protein EVG20_g9326 [Dentipellis fragilis]